MSTVSSLLLKGRGVTDSLAMMAKGTPNHLLAIGALVMATMA
jgi:hypothetical protein